MTVIIGLMAAALVLLFFEVILPGGILGVLAGLCVIAATIITAQTHGILAGGLLFVGSIFISIFVVYLQFKFLGNKLSLKASITGRSSEKSDNDRLIGATGETITRLNPTGMIDVEGKSYEAFSQDGYIEKGVTVKITSRDNFKLIIQKS